MKGLGLVVLTLLLMGVFTPLVGATSTWTAGTQHSTGLMDWANFSDASCVHHTFYANGLYWVFYVSNTSWIFFHTSVDGITWSGTGNTTIPCFSAQEHFDVFFDGIYFHFAAMTVDSTPSAIYYRRGLANSTGVITWSAALQNTGKTGSFPSVVVSSTGVVYIAYNNNYNYLLKDDNTDGTWSTAASFPLTLFGGSSAYYGVCGIPLAGGHIALVSYKVVHVQTYSGSGTSLSSEYAAAYDTEIVGGLSLTSNGDVLHIAYATYSDIYYTSYTYGGSSLSDEVTIATGGAFIKMSVAYSSTDNNVYIFWRESNTVIKYAYGSSGSFTTGTYLTTSATISNLAFGADYIFRNGKFPISYYSTAFIYLIDGSFGGGTPPPPTGTVSVIAQTDSTQAVRLQGKSFDAVGRSWIFYYNNHVVYYTSSVDTVTWLSGQQAYTGSLWLAENLGENLVAALDSTGHIHVAIRGYDVAAGVSRLVWNYGTPHADGSITWAGSWVAIWTTDQANYDLYLALDSSNHDWVTWIPMVPGSLNANATLFAIKNGNNDGTWSQTQNITIQASWATYHHTTNNFIIPLPSNKMLFGYFCTYPVAPMGVYCKIWDGTLGAEETITIDTLFTDYTLGWESYARGLSVDAGGNVYFAYLTSAYNLNVVTRNYGTGLWSSPTLIQSDTPGYSSPCLAINNGVLSLFYIHDGLHIYRSTFTGSWETPTSYLTTAVTIPTIWDFGWNGRLNSFGNDGLFFMENTTTAGLYNLVYYTATPHYYGPYYGSVGSGPIYFLSDFNSSLITYEDDLVTFEHMNMAGAGDFGTIGMNATAGVTLTIKEIIPEDHLLIQTSTLVANNVTFYLPGIVSANVTGASAWTWNNSTHLLRITAPVGIAQMVVSFTSGPGGNYPTIFYIPQWFIDQGGSFFGVANFFSSVSRVMAAFVTWFATAVTNIVALVASIIEIVFFVGTSVIYWFGLFVSFWVALFSFIGNILNGTGTISTGFGNVWTYFDVGGWIQFVPIVGTLVWFDSVQSRSKRGGRNHVEILIADIQVVLFIVGTVWEWSWTIFNFVFSTVMAFVSLLWGLIP